MEKEFCNECGSEMTLVESTKLDEHTVQCKFICKQCDCDAHYKNYIC